LGKGGCVTANQYRAALAKLELSQVRAARVLGVNEATSRRWARFGVTGTAEILLRLLADGIIKIQDIETARG
jgi:DNA-binding transcriptional regulator YiaG